MFVQLFVNAYEEMDAEMTDYMAWDGMGWHGMGWDDDDDVISSSI